MICERAITLLSGRYGGRAAPQAYLEFAQEHFLTLKEEIAGTVPRGL